MKVLIADDDQLLLIAVSAVLKREGYEIITAVDGQDALSKVKQYQPDVLITDLMMPYLNGLEVINQVKNVWKYDTAVIVLSAVGLEHMVIESFKLGVEDYIKKPFSLTELSFRIKKIAMTRQVRSLANS